MRGSLKIDFQEGDLTSLHPHDLIIHLRGISIAKTLYEGLTRIDQKGNAELAGAKSVDISLNGLSYVFKLRDNHWSDGTPVTAFQYEAAWKDALSPVSLCKRADLLYMIQNGREAKKGEVPLESIGVRALDAQTLLVELTRPSPHFLELLAQPICAPIKNLSDKTISHFNGPFVVDRWDRGSLLKLKPNKYFWNHASVALPAIDVYMVQDPETVYALYEEKKLDWIGVPLCSLTAEQIGHLKQKKSLQSHPVERAFWVFLNTQHPALSSPAIRKALSLALDRETITESFLIGGEPLDKPLPHALLPMASDSTLKEDLKDAREYFEAGLKDLGLSRANFPPLVISYAQQTNRKKLCEYLQQAWSQAFGIKVQLQLEEWNVLRSHLGTGEFAICGGFEASYCHDPLEIMERMVSRNPSNYCQWVFPLYQEKIASAGWELDMKRRLELLSEAEDILMDQMPFIPISSDRFLFSHHSKLKNYAFDSVGAIDFSYATMR